MKLIYNNIIPFRGFIAINLFGLVFVRNEFKGKVKKSTLTHESIHTAQMKELLYIGFYLLYMLFWFYNLVFHTSSAYMSIPFEREAYINENYDYYLSTRKHYSWIHYL